MNRWKHMLTFLVCTGLTLLAGAVSANGDGRMFEVTVTNITQGEIFTPIMVASHPRGVQLFDLGSHASSPLEMLAEGGDTKPLSAELKEAGALDVVTAGDVLLPGHSVTLYVKRDGRNRYLSVASMLVPSNDAFLAVNGVRGPSNRQPMTLYSPAYDAGTETNDELCVSIPGPPFLCAGEGYSTDGGEGYVYIHAGIQGVGDLTAAGLDWRNPVARISIRKTGRYKTGK